MPHLVSQEPKPLRDGGLVVVFDAAHGSIDVAKNGQHSTGHAHATVLDGLGFFSHHPFSDVLNFSFLVSDFFLGEFRSFKGHFQGITLVFRLFCNGFLRRHHLALFICGGLFSRNVRNGLING